MAENDEVYHEYMERAPLGFPPPLDNHTKNKKKDSSIRIILDGPEQY
jgi:hypothetical protein